MRPEFGSFHVKHGVTIWWRFFIAIFLSDFMLAVRRTCDIAVNGREVLAGIPAMRKSRI